MIRLTDFEYETRFKSAFSPKPDVYHFSEKTVIVKTEEKITKNSILNDNFAENLQNNEIKTEKQLVIEENQEKKQEEKQIAVVEPFSYEIKDVTPKKLFRRRKNVQTS